MSGQRSTLGLCAASNVHRSNAQSGRDQELVAKEPEPLRIVLGRVSLDNTLFLPFLQLLVLLSCCCVLGSPLRVLIVESLLWSTSGRRPSKGRVTRMFQVDHPIKGRDSFHSFLKTKSKLLKFLEVFI